MSLDPCVLKEGKNCTGCGECEICDLDETKVCDNCCQCLGESDYKAVEITEIVMPGVQTRKFKTTDGDPEKH